MVGSKNRSSAKNKGTSSSRSQVSAAGENAEDLIGSRIKVWWAGDRKYYEGVVESYLLNRKKHRIGYVDGGGDILNLKKRKWELLEAAEEESSEGTAEQKPSSSSEDGDENASSDDESTKPTKMTPRNENGEKNEKLKSLKSGKKVAEPYNIKTRSASSSKALSVKTKPRTDEVDVDETLASFLKPKKLNKMTLRKENGEENEKPKPLKSGKKVAEPKNSKKRPSSSSSKALSVKEKPRTDDGDDEVDVDETVASILKRKKLKKMTPRKENGEGKEKPKSLKSGDKVAEPNNLKKKPSSSSSKALSVEKKPRTDDELDVDETLESFLKRKKLKKMTPRKENGEEKEKPKSLTSGKNVAEPNNLKNMTSSSSKGENPRTDDGDNEVDVDEALASFLDCEKLKKMTLRKENGEEKEKPKFLKPGKNVAEPNNLKNMPASSSKGENPRNDDGDNEVDVDEPLASFLDCEKLKKMTLRKENGEEKEKPKSLKSGKNVAEPNNLKKRSASSSSKALSIKEKPKTDDGDHDNEVDVSELLVSIVNKTPEALKALVEKVKRRENKKVGEGSSPNVTEMEEESS